MGLVAKIAERVTEVLPHSGVDGSRELIIAPGPDIIAPAGNAVSTLPVAHVLMGLTIDLVSASIPFCAYIIPSLSEIRLISYDYSWLNRLRT
jgi:hypothetical protein